MTAERAFEKYENSVKFSCVMRKSAIQQSAAKTGIAAIFPFTMVLSLTSAIIMSIVAIISEKAIK